MKRKLLTRILPVLLSLALLLAAAPRSALKAEAASPKPEKAAANERSDAVSKSEPPLRPQGTRGDGYADWDFDELDVVDLEPDKETELSFAEDQYDLWLRFTPETLDLYCISSFGNVDVYVALFDENGNLLNDNDDGGEGYNFRMSSLLNARRTYYFRIGRYGANSGSLSFSVLLTAEGFDPIIIEPDQELSVTFDVGQAYVWLRFVPQTSANYCLASFGDVDPYATLMDENGFYLADADDSQSSWNFSLTYYMEAREVYYYRLGHYSDSDVPVKFSVLLAEYVPVTSGICGAQGDNLHWSYDPETKVLTIKGSGDMMDYWFHDAPWDPFRNEISEVSLPDGLSSIGSNAFCDCWRLTEVTVPDTVALIEDFAFWGCSSLYSITLPDHLSYLGVSAFNSCSALTLLTLPEGLSSIQPYTFTYCSSLPSLVIPEGVTEIGEYAFHECDSLCSVSIPEGVTTIGCCAFEGCNRLSSIALPETVHDIGAFAFNDCSSLASVGLPAALGKIETGAFTGCSSLDMLVIRNADCLASFVGEDFDPEDTDEDLDNDWSDTTLGEHTTVIYGRHDQEKLDSGDVYERYQYAEAYAANFGYTFYDLYAFNDVREYSWYEIPVAWACGNGITAGTGEGTFSPGNTCTREQTVTFLWKAAGSPEPETTENPFTDVKENKYYYKAVLWALENGITAGVDVDLFGVGMSCTREQVVTFLWKAAGSPEPDSEMNPFTDVKPNKYYYKPILWAVENGITAGVDVDLFGVGQDCTRAQIVTFLYMYEYRAMG